MTQDTIILQVNGASKRFGGLQALENVSLALRQGEVYGLIGPNGAGKTTFFNVITGLYKADQGDFFIKGLRYEPSAVDLVAKAGIARTFQNIRLFKEMTVLENVMVATHIKTHVGVWGALIQSQAFKREEEDIKRRALAVLSYVGIQKFASQRAKTLSYGDQRRLEIARALATEPLVLALDEPAAGMNATEKLALRALIQKIRQSGVSILLIEHDVKLVMGLCDRVSVLDEGHLICEGPPQAVQSNPKVIEAYLGLGASVHG
jgi:branched-chain amino acid transport system ATP-binding protein